MKTKQDEIEDPVLNRLERIPIESWEIADRAFTFRALHGRYKIELNPYRLGNYQGWEVHVWKDKNYLSGFSYSGISGFFSKEVVAFCKFVDRIRVYSDAKREALQVEEQEKEKKRLAKVQKEIEGRKKKERELEQFLKS
jgi:hypothetical protein